MLTHRGGKSRLRATVGTVEWRWMVDGMKIDMYVFKREISLTYVYERDVCVSVNLIFQFGWWVVLAGRN